MNTEEQDTGVDDSLPTELSLADKWIVSRLQQVEADIAKHFESYRLDLAANTLYEFVWNEYCDWYLELSKTTLNSDTSSLEQLRGTRKTLVRVLETILRLMHPITPFITEEAWQAVAPLAGKIGEQNGEKNNTIMLQPYPIADESKIDKEAIAELEWLKLFIIGIRKIRAEMNIPPSKKLPVMLAQLSEQDKTWFTNNKQSLLSLAKLESIEILENMDNAVESAIALVGEMTILIPMAGLIDKKAELERLQKELTNLKAK